MLRLAEKSFFFFFTSCHKQCFQRAVAARPSFQKSYCMPWICSEAPTCGELDLKSRKSFGGRAKQTRGLIGRTPVQANPAVPPSHPICGPWHKGADEQPLSANAILGLSSVACMVAAKRGLMASSFKGAPHQTLPPLEFLSSPTLYATFIALHLDNILSFALSGQIAATTKRWYEQRCWKVDIAIKTSLKKISLFL